MLRLASHICGVVALIGFSAFLALNNASAQQNSSKDQLVGTWKYVTAVNTRPDGSKFEPNGSSATGILMFDKAGNFSWLIVKSDIPKLASNNRQKGTPEEFQAVAKGVLAYFGTYTVDSTGKTMTMHVASSSFPNFDNATQKRAITLAGDTLTISNKGAASGGSADVKWTRME